MKKKNPMAGDGGCGGCSWVCGSVCCATRDFACCSSIAARQPVCMRCSVLKRVAACCSVLQRVAACCSVDCMKEEVEDIMCCSMLQHVAACCSVLRRVAARRPHKVGGGIHGVLQCVAVCCNVL